MYEETDLLILFRRRAMLAMKQYNICQLGSLKVAIGVLLLQLFKTALLLYFA
jgi:hypothetical protein